MISTIFVRLTCCFQRPDGREKDLFYTTQKLPAWYCNRCGTLVVIQRRD
jgi:hypothetical protein